mmetsp:Transcript_15157/g.37927  ORF Transcript_15157/g.37927 Transcript_15157/m.37927 type:complete len:114 (+) Transcript_15157:237-578(+)
MASVAAAHRSSFAKSRSENMGIRCGNLEASVQSCESLPVIITSQDKAPEPGRFTSRRRPQWRLVVKEYSEECVADVSMQFKYTCLSTYDANLWVIFRCCSGTRYSSLEGAAPS